MHKLNCGWNLKGDKGRAGKDNDMKMEWFKSSNEHAIKLQVETPVSYLNISTLIICPSIIRASPIGVLNQVLNPKIGNMG